VSVLLGEKDEPIPVHECGPYDQVLFRCDDLALIQVEIHPCQKPTKDERNSRGGDEKNRRGCKGGKRQEGRGRQSEEKRFKN